MKRLVLALLLGAGMLYWVHHRDPETIAFTAILVIAGYAYVLSIPIRLLVTGQAIVVTSRDLIDRTRALNFVYSDEIVGAELYPVMGLKPVALNLTNVEAVVIRISPLRR